MAIRKNQKNMTVAEWTAFIAAVDAMHGTAALAPAYRSFVNLHVDAMDMSHMDWSVHTMSMGGSIMRGKNFLTWHRRFLKLFEVRMQKENPAITIPYWDSVTDRAIPAALDKAALLTRWSVTRNWTPSQLAAASDLTAVKNYPGTFTGFQTLLEGAVHGGTHNAVGGNMAGSASPSDPLFWLHHSFIDKTWADWQASANGKNPPTPSKILKPANMEPGVSFGVSINSLLSLAALGYSYA
jgi:tyrosinase